MAETSYTKGEERPPNADIRSPEGDDPSKPDVAAGTDPYDVDTSFWEKALADAERAEKDWRARGREIVQIYNNYDFTTEILVASCRNPIHVIEAARMGADIATCPPAVIDQLFNHPLTNIGLDKFLKDWEKSQAVKA